MNDAMKDCSNQGLRREILKAINNPKVSVDAISWILTTYFPRVWAIIQLGRLKYIEEGSEREFLRSQINDFLSPKRVNYFKRLVKNKGVN